MIFLPAIDLIDGKCVRLSQGDYKKRHCIPMTRQVLLALSRTRVQGISILSILMQRKMRKETISIQSGKLYNRSVFQLKSVAVYETGRGR